MLFQVIPNIFQNIDKKINLSYTLHLMDDSISSNIAEEAIDAALSSNWEKALDLNSKIIKDDPGNIDALNRLAHAYFELCDYKLAKKFYSLALDVDQYNPIALKNLKIIQSFKNLSGQKPSLNHHAKILPSLFLQEPGKTKVVSLIKVAEPQKLSKAYCGMGVELSFKNRGITITDEFGGYLGVLPDDIAHRLIRMVKGGNRYSAFIKSIKVNGISILIRETYRASRFKNQPSFLEFSNSYSPEIIHTLNTNSIKDEDPIYEEDQ